MANPFVKKKETDTMPACEHVRLARHPQRPDAQVYLDALFTDFFAQCGDRYGAEDTAICGGIALFHGKPVTVLAQRKGETLDEKLQSHFGMPSPEGYRKAIRLVEQAEKFRRPVIAFINTAGAYPGADAEAHGQGDAIAKCIAKLSTLTVPVISVITGEGGSGGALAFGVANRVIMLSHAVYSILSPEGFASILWKDASRADEASELMQMTAHDLKQGGIIDHIVHEPQDGMHTDAQTVLTALDSLLQRELRVLCKKSPAQLVQERYDKFRAIGADALED